MAAQAMELVPALGGLGAEFTDRGGRRLTYRPEASFKIETRQPFLVGAQLVEQRAMGGVLLRFHALDDPRLDVVEGDSRGGRLLLGAAFRTDLCKPHVRCELVEIERREYFERRPVVVRFPLQS